MTKRSNATPSARAPRKIVASAASTSGHGSFKVVRFRHSQLCRSLKMQRSMFRLILASFLSIAISAALGADLSRWSQGNGYPAQGQIGCSCDAPGSTVWFAPALIGARTWAACAWGVASTLRGTRPAVLATRRASSLKWSVWFAPPLIAVRTWAAYALAIADGSIAVELSRRALTARSSGALAAAALAVSCGHANS